MNAITYYYSKSFESKDSKEKQKIGQRIVEALEGNPGPLGPDGGIDGFIKIKNIIYAFQVKLSNRPISRDVVSAFKVHALGKNALGGIIISIHGLSSAAKKYLDSEEYSKSGKFPLANLTINDIIMNFHYEKLRILSLDESDVLAQRLNHSLIE